MCIGIPMQIVERGDEIAVCEGRGSRERINCLMVGAQEPGTWVLTFQAMALRVIGADEAAQTNAALDALAAVLAGAGSGPAGGTEGTRRGTDVEARFAARTRARTGS